LDPKFTQKSENDGGRLNPAQRIVKNFLSLSVATIFTQLLGFITIPYLARVLGPGNFGKLNFASAISGYFSLIGNFGLSILGTRELARNKDTVEYYTGNVLALKLCLSVLSFGLLLLLVAFINKPLQIKYLILLYGLALFPSALLIDWVFQGMERMEYIGVSRIFGVILNVGLVLLLIKSSEQLLLVPCFSVLASFFSLGFLIFVFIRHFGKFRLKFNLISWKSLIKQALPIGFSSVMVLIIYNIDTIMLGFTRSNEEVGYYNAAYKIIFLLIFANVAYHDAIFPTISDYYKTSVDSLKKLLSITEKLIVTIAIPLAIGGTILAKPIMNLIYGAKYNGGIIAFQILIWAVAAIYILMGYARGLWACDRQNKYFMVVSIQAAANTVLNIMLIPSIGLIGAAVTTVVSEFLGCSLYYREFSKIVRVSFHNHIPKPLVASIVMALFLIFGLKWVHLNIFWLIAGGASVYSVFFYLIGGITKEEIKLIRSII